MGIYEICGSGSNTNIRGGTLLLTAIKSAMKGRELVAKKMTPADISAAQQMAREWMAQHP
jgi:hypothetical protein